MITSSVVTLCRQDIVQASMFESQQQDVRVLYTRPPCGKDAAAKPLRHALVPERCDC